MKVYIVIKDEGTTYNPYEKIKGVFSTEEKAKEFIHSKILIHENRCGIQEWEIDE